jgi:hypothetical protein
MVGFLTIAWISLYFFFYLFNISSGSKFCPTLLETIGLCVSYQNLRDSPLFKIDITCHNCPSSRCALVAYANSRDIGIFNGKSVLLNKNLLC